MKKIVYLGMALMLMMVSSCVQEMDENFDTSASERVQSKVDELSAMLVKPEHGWVMEYYPHANQKFGGYIYTMKFDENDNVTVAGELHNDATAQKSSLYSIKKDKGVTLNFDTYNEIFHYLADPDPSWASNFGHVMDGVVLTEGYAYEGDYEFVLNEIVSPTEILFLGKKTKNLIRMKALEEPMQNYLEKIIAKRQESDAIPGGTVGFKMELDGKELFFELDRARHFIVSYDGEEIAEVGECPTLDGWVLYEPVEVAGRTLQHFTFANNAYTCTDAGATDIVLQHYVDPSYLAYEEYLGDYVGDFDGNKVNVTIEPLVEGQTFKLRGMLSAYDVVLNYNATTGKVAMHTQLLKTEEGRDLWLCVITSLGAPGWSAGEHFDLEWNLDKENMVLTFKDNRDVLDKYTGIYQIKWNSGTFYEDYEWIGWVYGRLNSLTKKK